MQLPDGYSLHTPIDDGLYEESPIWDSVEDIAMNYDVGIDHYSSTINQMVLDPNNVNVASVWSSKSRDEFNFNIAIVEEEQSKGFGSILLDTVMADFQKEKDKNPNLKLVIAAINPILMSAMFRRGLYASKDLRNVEGEESVIMEVLPSLNDLSKKSLRNNAQQFFSAIESSAKSQDFESSEWGLFFEKWTTEQSPLTKNQQEAMEELVLALPLDELDKHCLWDNIQLAKGEERKPFVSVKAPLKNDDLEQDEPEATRQQTYSPANRSR